LNVGSLFSGIGGIELGFEKAGFETIWFIECEKYAKEVIKKHWCNAIVYDDITKVDFKAIPKVDIITGGFPCQDISFAGKGVGISGSRSSLWKYYYESIRVLRPRYAFIENVSAILGRGLNVVLADLASLGYDAEWYCVPASSVGAPHQRDRLFVISYLPFTRNGRLSVSKRGQKKKGFDIDGNSKTISDSQGTGEMPIQQQGQRNVPVKIGKIVTDSNSKRLSDIQRNKEQTWQSGNGTVGDSGWWNTEPDLGRMADGISNRVDRIRCLGNAVVPQVAEVFAQAIKEREETGGVVI
jgi:DNA (cytosine-5)-methyltransferase 1